MSKKVRIKRRLKKQAEGILELNESDMISELSVPGPLVTKVLDMGLTQDSKSNGSNGNGLDNNQFTYLINSLKDYPKLVNELKSDRALKP